jgi:hypothetical protein
MADAPMRLNNQDLLIYSKRCDVLKQLILKAYGPHIHEFKKNESTGYIEVCFKMGGTITILHDNTWSELEKNIGKKLDGNANHFCSVCSGVKNKLVTCNKCSQSFCTECYIDSFRKNKGLVVCPHCNYSFGVVMSDEVLEDRIDNIRDKIEDWK